MDKSQIRAHLLFCFKNEFSATDAAKMINKAFEEDVITIRLAQERFQRFRSGDFSLENKERGRPPLKLDRAKLKEKVEENPRTTLRELAAAFNVVPSTILDGLEAIGKKRKLDRWVPHKLTDEQKANRLQIASSLLERNAREPFLHRIVTCDEKWVYHDNSRRRGSWLDADEPPQHHPKPDLFPKKIMLTVWWTQQHIVHYSFLPRGRTIDSAAYKAEMDVMHEKLRALQPALLNRHGVILLHDNARPHTSVETARHIKEKRWEVLPHPAYSPDLSPTDFHLFRDLDNFLQGKVFRNDEAAINATAEFLDSRTSDNLKKGFEKLPVRWSQASERDGEYFE